MDTGPHSWFPDTVCSNRTAEPAVDRSCGGHWLGGWVVCGDSSLKLRGQACLLRKEPLEPTARLVRRVPGDQQRYLGFPGGRKKELNLLMLC